MTSVLRIVPILAVISLAGHLLAAQQEYRVAGMVIKVDRSAPAVVIAHNTIPGLMDAMTMSFGVRDKTELDGLVPGSMVEFTLIVTAESAYATRILVRPYESVEQDPLNARRLALLNRIAGASPPLANEVAIGQTVPEFTLTNQAHRVLSFSQLRGKVAAVNFIYTTCALPQFCLRTANNFGVLQKRFARELGRDLVLLSVTFDPARDTPDVLAQYASQWKANPATWHFLTGESRDVQRVGQIFGMAFFPNEGLFDHSLRTAIVDREGLLVANLEGNQFTAAQLGDLIQSVLDRPVTQRW